MSALLRPPRPIRVSGGSEPIATDAPERSRSFARGATWELPGLAALAGLAAILYAWNLVVSGYANTYYSMAAQAASQSWSAWFFGSLDASGFITLDKPPLATMVMGLSVRLLGLSSWSILLPQALMGVATVVVLFLAVRRSFGPGAGLVAGVAMALTPAAVLIFRYNNPDALLTLLLVSAAWALLRALDAGRMRWLVLAGTLVGLAFTTKFLQAFLVLPAFTLVWAVAAPGGWRRRVVGLAVSAASVAITSAAWIAAVMIVPPDARPYIGGSTTNSVLDLVLGYDGLGRIFGGSASPASGGQGGMFGGAAGLLRLFNDQFAGQVSWLIPFGLVALASGLATRIRAGRTNPALVGYLLWGGWLVAVGLVFSLMSGIIHSYYTVALAPAIAALVGAGVVELWRLRERSIVGGLLLAGALVATGAWAYLLLGRTPDFVPGLDVAVLALAVAAAIVVAVPAVMSTPRVARVAIMIGIIAMLAGPTAYAAQTMSSAHSGGDPSAGPTSSVSAAFGGGPGGPGGGQLATAGGVGPGAAPSGIGGGAGGPGGAVDSTLTTYLAANAGAARWIVAVTGSSVAAEIQLATGLPVMSMGGFNGSDATPTAAQLQAFIARGELRYVLISGNGGGGPGGGQTSTARDSWVTSSCAVVDTGTSGGTLYDCAGVAGG